MMESKWVDHWTSGTVYECSEIAGSPYGSPPATDYVCCEAGRRTCSECETGTEELCEIRWDYHIVDMTNYSMRKKISPAKNIAPLFSRIYRYVPKGLEVFSLQVLSSFMFGLQDLEKKI
jgi:hypothetical protein